MRRLTMLTACGLVGLVMTASRADERNLRPGAKLFSVPSADSNMIQVQAVEAVADAPAASFEQSGTDCNDPPVMIGDVFGFGARQAILVPRLGTTTVTTTRVVESSTGLGNAPITTTTTSTTSSNSAASLISPAIQCNPYAGRAAFKISQNESPLPQTRVFLGYQYIDNVRCSDMRLPALSSTSTSVSGPTTVFLIDPIGETFTRQTTTVTTTTSTSFLANTLPSQRVNAHHEIMGFEYALSEGFSIGMRVPFVQQHGDGSLSSSDFGDISVIAKVLLLSNAENGSGLSGGLMVTAPTGPDILTIRGNINSTLIQPFIGGLWRSGNLFVQGFSSVVIPTDSDDVTLLLNSIGAGYVLYRSDDSGLLSSVAPVVEVHITTPTNDHGSLGAVHVPDMVNLTTGVEVGVGARGLLTVGATFPINGDDNFDVGILAAFNLRF